MGVELRRKGENNVQRVNRVDPREERSARRESLRGTKMIG